MLINRQVDINFFESAFIPKVMDSSTGHTYSKTSGNFLYLEFIINFSFELDL